MPENHGMKVSPAGSDVKTVTDIESRFTSKYPYMKVYKWDTVSFTTNASGNYTYTIPHDLGYAPAFDVFVKGTAAFSFLTGTTYPNSWFRIGGANRWFNQDEAGGFFAYSDASNLYIQAIDGFKSQSVTVKYYLYVDPIQEFTSASNIDLTGDYGMKVSKTGKEVRTAEEYDMRFSTKYKQLQYFKESIKSETLTLPAMWASYVDQDVEEATYVDFLHGLGYPPLFHAYFEPSSNLLREVPYHENDLFYSSGVLYYDDVVYEVSAWCDATRIRVTFYRRSSWVAPDFYANRTFSAQTITIGVVPFAENLEGLDYGE